MRTQRLERERARAAAEFRAAAEALEAAAEDGGGEGAKAAVVPLGQRFAATSASRAEEDEEFTRRTTGLVSAAQFRTKRRELVDELSAAAAHARAQQQAADERTRLRKKQKTVHAAALSFAGGEEEDEGECEAVAARLKNPAVETSFLPDRGRELREAEARERLAREWLAAQERIRAQPIEVTYSFWDGSGHRRALTVAKGTTIAQFLDRARAEFRELRAATVDQLLFVKEDLIIPHTLSFYDLIESRARGKSGPLFHFDVHDDVRLVSDASVEKDESHAAKIVERHWYEHNKHIFPANRWEVYDPSAAEQRESYTIRDSHKPRR